MDIFLVEPLASRFSKEVVCSAEVAFRHFDLLVNEENEAIFCFIILQNMCPVKPPKHTGPALLILPFSSARGLALAICETDGGLAVRLGL